VPTPGTGRRKEIGGVIWRAPDGSFYANIRPDPGATECHYTIPVPVIPPIAGSEAIAKFHVHPSRPGEDVYGCLDKNGNPTYAQVRGDGKPVPTSDNEQQGGGSPADWGQADSDTYPSYTYNKNQRVFRLDPGTSPFDRQSNPNKWQRGATGCFTRIP
jgi:hypothetical protein